MAARWARDKYAFKLDWYRRLRSWLDAECDRATDLLICGDFNVAPDDRDVYDPDAVARPDPVLRARNARRYAG